MSEYELKMLTVIRAELMIALDVIESMITIPRGSEEEEPDDCYLGRHPIEGRVDASVMGCRKYLCAACKQVVEEGK
jgi:hypothetical protein